MVTDSFGNWKVYCSEPGKAVVKNVTIITSVSYFVSFDKLLGCILIYVLPA
jgi:hypothetical protein